MCVQEYPCMRGKHGFGKSFIKEIIWFNSFLKILSITFIPTRGVKVCAHHRVQGFEFVKGNSDICAIKSCLYLYGQHQLHFFSQSSFTLSSFASSASLELSHSKMEFKISLVPSSTQQHSVFLWKQSCSQHLTPLLLDVAFCWALLLSILFGASGPLCGSI